ncbi:sialate O-acetylesterase [Marinagarivorans algicola]|uniref:sialate O-acetylesterase n=1 Tax=Marinagarivorans algicola TaxID=1513270 RepID=UPI0037369CCA
MKNTVITLMMMLISATTLAESLSLSSLFADHMVLQRKQAIAVWGSGTRNTTVTVSLGSVSQVGKVDSEGRWKVHLPPQAAGGPFKLTVSSGSDTIILTDVLIGDVWLASGQSNMEWKVDWKINNLEAEKKDSHFPKIRFFSVNTDVKLDKQQDVYGSRWQVASEQTVGDFSAAAWFFAKAGFKEKGVPIGIIDSTVGGTPAQAWTPLENLLTLDGYKAVAQDMKNNPDIWEKRIEIRARNEENKRNIIRNDKLTQKFGFHRLSFDDTPWKVVNIPLAEPLSDIVWLRKTIELNHMPKQAQLSLGSITQLAKFYVNGVLVEEKTWKDKTKVITLPRNLLKKGQNIIALRVVNDWDNKVQVGKDNEVWLSHDGQKMSLAGQWRYNNTVEPPLPEVERISSWPTGLYNAMIHPLTPASIKGVIWYQGEANVDRAQEYQTLFTALINGWRTRFERPDLPFVFVQLAGYLPKKNEPSESDWALLREQQAKTLALPYTAMAVTIDIGEAHDIHPRNKQDVGRRLWLAAKTVAYGDEVDYSGPTYQSLNVDADKASIQLTFKANTPLVMKGDTLKGFEIAGQDGRYYRAQARITGDKTVSISSPNVLKPLFVRYAWADNSSANLYDGYRLPAVPFRSDASH